MLPGTQRLIDFYERTESLATMHAKLRKGVLPRAEELAWPDEPFKSQFLRVMSDMEMARFCRRHPKLMSPLFDRMIQMVGEFEHEVMKAQQEQEMKQQQSQQQQSPPSGSSGQDEDESQEDEDGEGGMSDSAQEQMQDLEEMLEELQDQQGNTNAEQGEQDGQKKEIQIGMTEVDVAREDDFDKGEQVDSEMESRKDDIARELMSEFKDEWGKAMEVLEEAGEALDDVDGLIDGPEGFDLSLSVWKNRGWKEVEDLRKMLEDLKELRELVRSLGRGGGRGPIRLAPQEVRPAAPSRHASAAPPARPAPGNNPGGLPVTRTAGVVAEVAARRREVRAAARGDEGAVQERGAVPDASVRGGAHGRRMAQGHRSPWQRGRRRRGRPAK